MKIKKTLNPRTKTLLVVLSGVLTVVILITGILCYQHFTRVGFLSTGEHPLANELQDKIDILPYFKDGHIYYYQNGKKTLVATNAYDKDAEDPVLSADYAIDKVTGKMLYTSAGSLFLYDAGNTVKIADNVTSWRTSQEMRSVSFTTKWHNSSDRGMLFLYRDGETCAVDTDIINATVRFSQNGEYLFYEKPNVFPEIRSMLFKYSIKGEKTLVHESSFPVLWVDDDGTKLVTGENIDDGLYTYRLFTNNLKKQKVFNNVYYSDVTDDKSILYMLCDYDYDTYSGTLTAVDLNTLKTKEIAKNVSFFDVSVVTDASKGVVYSVKTDTENDLFSIYFGDISGKSTRLIHNTMEDSLYNVIVNTDLMEGYVLSLGATRMDGGIYSIKWDKNDLVTKRIASGNVDSLIYYEKTHSITFIKNPDETTAELYITDFSGNVRLLSDSCGVQYQSGTQSYQSSSVLSENNEKTLYFTDIKTGKTTVDTSGTLYINENKISDYVSSGYMEAPITDKNFSQVFFLKKQNEKMDLYLFNGQDTVLIDENVQGLIQLT